MKNVFWVERIVAPKEKNRAQQKITRILLLKMKK